jgi:sugar lactone lactonase YvrE
MCSAPTILRSLAIAGLLVGCDDSQPSEPTRADANAALPAALNAGSGPPEDIKVSGSTAYVSNVADGSVLKLDLAAGGAASTFVPAATDAYHAAWGLKILDDKHWLLSIQNQAFDFVPDHAQAGRLVAFDLTTGAKRKSWDLPAQTVGNSVDVDDAGNIYVGDFGPSPRILRIDPVTDTVSTWATSDQWVSGGLGVGGMVYSGAGLYAAHNNLLWYIAIHGDGTSAAPEAVKIAGDPVIFADGMAWTGGGLVYAENDALVAGPHGTVFSVQFSDPTTATRSVVHADLQDPSGVAEADVDGHAYLLVNESQLGFVLGVDTGQRSVPYHIKVFPR